MIVNRKNIKNPYLLAYMDVHNIRDGEDIKNTNYMFWIDKKHNEYRKLKGLPEHIELNNNEVKEFVEFIRKDVIVWRKILI